MSKSELIEHVAQRAGLSQEQAGRAVRATLATIEETLGRGGELNVSGFGRFHVARRAGRAGVNPRTGEPIQVPAVPVARFSPGAGLKRAVRGR